MKAWSALLSVAAVLACSSRGSLVAPASTNAAGAQGLAGAGGAPGAGDSTGSGGAAGAVMPLAICPSRTGRRPGQLAVQGSDGSDIILVHDDGATQRVNSPDARSALAQRNGWIAAYNYGGTAAWKAILIDSTGHVRAESSGQAPPGPAGTWAISQANVLPDGTATFDLDNSQDDLVLTPDGRVRRRPYFSTQPDAAGWVATNLPMPKLAVGLPVMLNVETGEIRNLSLLAAGDGWAPIVSGARRLYLTELQGKVVLVDESPDGARTVVLPGYARAVLEVVTTPLADGRPVAYVSLNDQVNKNVPVWIYDLATGALDSALPDGTLPAQSTGFSYPDGRIDVIAGNSPWVGGTRLWSVELSMGAIFDYRAGLTVRRIQPATGGPPRWIPLADGAKEIYRYDRAAGALEDLHVAGDLTTSGERPLVTRDGRPLAVLNLDDGEVTAIPGGASLAPAVALIRAAGRWAVGHAGVPGATWAPGVPLWRVDLETGETAAFPTVDASLTPLLGGTAPIFGGGGTTLLADGRVGVTIYDGLGVGLYLAEPGGSWQAVGRRAREVTWFGWAGGPAFVIAAERDCHCYGPLTLSWPPPPAVTPDLLSGTSLQFIAPDGTDVFPPTTTEQLVAFSDDSNSCALVKTDANEWFVVDIQARTRVSLGRADGFGFVTDAP